MLLLSQVDTHPQVAAAEVKVTQAVLVGQVRVEHHTQIKPPVVVVVVVVALVVQVATAQKVQVLALM
jgi:hypothetical protein